MNATARFSARSPSATKGAGAERSDRSRTGASLFPACAGATHATSEAETRRKALEDTEREKAERAANRGRKRSSRSDSVIETAAKSAARSVARSLGRELVRGLLGMLRR